MFLPAVKSIKEIQGAIVITLVSSLRAEMDHIQITQSTAVMTDSLRQLIHESPQRAKMRFYTDPVEVTLHNDDGHELLWIEPDGKEQRRRIVTAPIHVLDVTRLPLRDQMAIVGSHVLSGAKIGVAFDDRKTADAQMRILFKMYPQIKVKDRKDFGGEHHVIFVLVDPSRN